MDIVQIGITRKEARILDQVVNIAFDVWVEMDGSDTADLNRLHSLDIGGLIMTPQSIQDLCRDRLLERHAERHEQGASMVTSYLKHVLFAGNFVPVADVVFSARIGDRDKFSAVIYADETKAAAVSARLGYFVDVYQRVTAGNSPPGETIDQRWVASKVPGREFDCVIDAMLAETGWTLEDLS